MNIIETIEEIDKMEKKYKQMLIQKIQAWPENQKITPISDNCFTINRKDLGKGLILSPEYHSFQCQYNLIIKWIQEDPLSTVSTRIKTIIEKGCVYVGPQKHLFHPKVVDFLKGL